MYLMMYQTAGYRYVETYGTMHKEKYEDIDYLKFYVESVRHVYYSWIKYIVKIQLHFILFDISLSHKQIWH